MIQTGENAQPQREPGRGENRKDARDDRETTIASLSQVHLRDALYDDVVTPVVRLGVAKASEMPDRIAHYQVAGEIARGGVGVVLKARDSELGRDVALKVLLDEHRGDPDLLRRFIEEAQIGGQMQHPGIVPIHGMGLLEGGLPFFSMKLVKGRTLAALLEERRAPEQDHHRFLGIFDQICRTLAYAHSRRVIHRDLKPSNIMVGAFGEVQVMDWGLAKVFSADGTVYEDRSRVHRTRVSIIETLRSGTPGTASLAGSILGTPAYMAPEQARGEIDEVDERSDVFGLGAILCEVLSGQPPYLGATSETVFQNAKKGYLEEAFSRLDACGAEAELIALAKTCLAFEPRDRPAEAGAVSREIKRHLDSLEERARRSSLERAAARVRAREERRARRLGVVLGSAVLALVVVAGGGYLWVDAARRARTEEAVAQVRERLVEANALLGRARAAGSEDLAPWDAALAAAERAVARGAGAADTPTRAAAAEFLRQVESEVERARAAAERAERNRLMVERLEAIRAARDSDPDRLGMAYRRAFGEYGIDVERLPSADAAERLRTSGIEVELAGALDEWARWKKNLYGADSSGWKKLLRIAGAADSDAWRKRLREALEGDDLTGLRRLAAEEGVWEASPASLLLLASRLHEVSDDSRARLLLHGARLRYPDDFWVNAALGEQGSDAADRLVHATAAVALRPRSPVARTLLGWNFDAQGWDRYEEAVASFEAALQIQPDNAWTLIGLGTALRRRQVTVDAAIRRLEAAIRLHPASAVAHNNLGLAYERKQDYESAVREYREAIRLQPSHAPHYGNLAFALRELGNTDGAIAAFREAVRVGPEDSQAHWYHHNLGVALFARGQLEAAVYHAREAIRLSPETAAHYFDLAKAYHMQGKLAEALGAFQRGYEVNPQIPRYEPRNVLTRLEAPEPRDPEFDRALKSLIDMLDWTLRSGVEHHPNVARAYMAALNLRIQTLDASSALELARREVEKTQRQSAEALGLLARAYELAGSTREAILSLEEAADLDDFSEPLARRLAEYRGSVRPDLITYGSIDAALEEAVVLVPRGASWRYFKGTSEPSARLDWALAGFDDDSWEEGESGFGFGDGDDRTLLTDMGGNYPTLYIRHTFEVADPAGVEGLVLSVLSDDGFIAYLNGEEVGRRRVPGLPGVRVPHDLVTGQTHEAVEADVLEVATRSLVPGRNLLAIQGFQSQRTSSDFTLSPELHARLRPDLDRDSQRFVAFRAAARDDDATARIAYLEGRLLQRAGNLDAGARQFEKVTDAGTLDPLPYLRLAQCLRGLGRSAEADVRIRRGFAAGVRASRELLGLWVALGTDLERTWRETLRAWPRQAPTYARVLTATGEKTPQSWRFTTARPASGWQETGFDDAIWKTGTAPFGAVQVPLAWKALISTAWTARDIWLRRTFEATPASRINPRLANRLELRVLHDDDAIVYLNGEEVARLEGWSASLYHEVRLDDPHLLRDGVNTLAVHCHNNAGAQVIDAGLMEIIVPLE